MIGDILVRLRNTLATITRQQEVTVLAVRNIGSHAWQLAGPDSDYDVGFLYAQEPIAYATLGEYTCRSSTTPERQSNSLAGTSLDSGDC